MNPDRKAERLREVSEHLGSVDETALIVLKGHLLIEEALWRIITGFLFRSDMIEDARLTFAQKVAIARAMSLDSAESGLWELILALNSLRNDLAHNLASPRRHAREERVRTIYQREAADIQESAPPDAPITVVAALSVGLSLGFLDAFEEEVERFRAAVDDLDMLMNPHRHPESDGPAANG